MDPDLQIRQGRGVGVEVRGSHPGTEISRGGGGLKKKFFFWALGPQFGLKIRGGLPGPAGPSLDQPLLRASVQKFLLNNLTLSKTDTFGISPTCKSPY